jgi:NDP-sugar pyrophosphorylase family protein
MSLLTAKLFFSLQQYRHRDLWCEEDGVWIALQHLENYLHSFPSFKINIEIPDGVCVKNPEMVSIGEGTVLEPGVLIEGPCILGKDCHIRHGAFLRGGVLCGDRCVVGHSAEIKHSIFLDDVQAAHLNYVGDSILGNGVNLGAGVKCANLRLDRNEIAVHFEGQKVQTGLKKFGCILGDGCQIGCNVVLNPGTLVGPNSISYPLLNLHGFIPANSRLKGKAHEYEIETTAILNH